MRLALVLTFLIGLCGTASAQAVTCQVGLERMQVADLLFGRSVRHRHDVTDREWMRFLDREVTPRFPDGLTVTDANGQWRDTKRNKVIRERSKVLMIVFKDDAKEQEKLTAIAEAYKRRFRQQSVGIVVRPACAGF